MSTAHLRIATHQQNNQNASRAQRNSLTGVRGVELLPSGRYRAQVGHNGTKHHLGIFPTIEAASEAAATKRSILFGAEFAGGN